MSEPRGYQLMLLAIRYWVLGNDERFDYRSMAERIIGPERLRTSDGLRARPMAAQGPRILNDNLSKTV
jgi:hypothetical protein